MEVWYQLLRLPRPAGVAAVAGVLPPSVVAWACSLSPSSARLASAVFAAARVLLLGFPQWLATLGFTAVVVTPLLGLPTGL